MIKNKKLLIISSLIFVMTEICLSYQIQTTTAKVHDRYAYASVLLACFFFFLFLEKTRAYLFTQLGLIFTAGADYFLVHIDNQDKLNGMICFVIAQFFYFLLVLFYDSNKARRKAHVIIRTSLSLAIIVVALVVLGESADTVAILSALYFANLLLNLIFSFIQFKSIPVLAIGFLCFILCDIVIGFANIGPYFNLPADSFIHKILNPGFDPAWAFYVPSQFLIALSLLPQRTKKERV